MWFSRRKKQKQVAEVKQRELRFADAVWDFLTFDGRVEWEYIRATSRVTLPNGAEVIISVKD